MLKTFDLIGLLTISFGKLINFAKIFSRFLKSQFFIKACFMMNPFSINYDTHTHSKFMSKQTAFQVTMDNSNLIKVTAAIVTAGLVVCSIWFYTKNKIFTTKIENKNPAAPENFNKSTISEISQQISSQEEDESVSRNSSQEEVKSLQVSSQGEQDDDNTGYLRTQSQEPLANDSEVELTPEIASQATCNKDVTIQSCVLEPEESGKHEEIQKKSPRIPKIDPPIMYDHTTTPEVEPEKSDTNNTNEDVDPKPVEVESRLSPNEDACTQTESKVSRSIILNYQIPVSIPLPNETASDMLNEFCLSGVIHAFTGQDLIDLEEYDEEEEIRRFLFKKDN